MWPMRTGWPCSVWALRHSKTDSIWKKLLTSVWDTYPPQKMKEYEEEQEQEQESLKMKNLKGNDQMREKKRKELLGEKEDIYTW
jgi:hypothetical protein